MVVSDFLYWFYWKEFKWLSEMYRKYGQLYYYRRALEYLHMARCVRLGLLNEAPF